MSPVTIYRKEKAMKQCCTCKISKPLENFYNAKSGLDGKQRQCKECRKLSDKPELSKARSKRYREAHLDEVKAKSKAWRESNPTYSINYYYNNKEEWLKRTAKYSATRYENDPLYRIQRILSSQVWYYLAGKTKSQRTMNLIGYTPQQFIDALGERQPGFDIDHKIPVTWFTEETPLSIIWHLNNLQWIEAKQNKAKGNRHMHPVSENYLQQALPYIREEFASFVKK